MTNAMHNLSITYDATTIGIQVIYKDGKYHVFKPDGSEPKEFVSNISAFKHLIYLMSIDCGLGGLIPK